MSKKPVYIYKDTDCRETLADEETVRRLAFVAAAVRLTK